MITLPQQLALGLCLLVVSTLASAQPVVINKVYNAGDGTLLSTQDGVELLVVQPSLSLSGYLLKNFSAGGTQDNGALFQFTSTALWQQLPAGTLVVLRNDASAKDTTATDFVLDVGLLNTRYFRNLGNAWDVQATDVVLLKRPYSLATGVDSITYRTGVLGAVHTLGFGLPPSSYFTLAPAPKLQALGTLAPPNWAYATNPNAQLADYNGTAVGISALGTPYAGVGHDPWGKPNTLPNATYLQQLQLQDTLLGLQPTLLAFDTLSVGRVLIKGCTVKGQRLAVPITMALPAGPFALSTDSINFGLTTQLPPAGGRLYVRFAPPLLDTVKLQLGLHAGTRSASLLLTGQGVNPYGANGPALSFVPSSLSLTGAAGGPAQQATYQVIGSHLFEPIHLKAPSNLYLSRDGTTFYDTLSLPPGGGTVVVRWLPGGSAPGVLSLLHTAGGTVATLSISTAFTGSLAQGAVLLSPTTPLYTQNFDALPPIGSHGWGHPPLLLGWLTADEAGDTLLVANSGTLRTGGLYSYGVNGTTNRALGGLPSGGSGNLAWGVVINNASDSLLSTLHLSYKGQRWRGGTSWDTLQVSYQPMDKLPASLAVNQVLPAEFTAAPTLAYAALPEALVALNGSQPAYQQSITGSLPLQLAPHGYALLRWHYPETGGTHHALAIDDLTLQAEFAPNIATLSLAASLHPFRTTINQPSASQPITLGGYGLSSAVTCTVTPPFELSVDAVHYSSSINLPPGNGALRGKTYWLRLAARPQAGLFTGIANLQGGGATAATTPLAGEILPPPLLTVAAVRAGMDTLVGKTVRLAGRLTLVGDFGPGTLALQDATGGVFITCQDDERLFAGLLPGDSVTVDGPWQHVAADSLAPAPVKGGRWQLYGPKASITLARVAVPAVLPQAQTVSLQQLVANPAKYQGQLVTITQLGPAATIPVLVPAKSYTITVGGLSAQFSLHPYSNFFHSRTDFLIPAYTPASLQGVWDVQDSATVLLPRHQGDMAVLNLQAYYQAPQGVTPAADSAFTIGTWQLAKSPTDTLLPAVARWLATYNYDVLVLTGAEPVVAPKLAAALNQLGASYRAFGATASTLSGVYRTTRLDSVSFTPAFASSPYVTGWQGTAGRQWPWRLQLLARLTGGATIPLHLIGINGRPGTRASDNDARVRDYRQLKTYLDSLSTAGVACLALGNFQQGLQPSGGLYPYLQDSLHYLVPTWAMQGKGLTTARKQVNLKDHLLISAPLLPAALPGSGRIAFPDSLLPYFTSEVGSHVPLSYSFDLTAVQPATASDSSKATLLAYPNPSTHQLNAQLFLQAPARVELSLINLEGKLVFPNVIASRLPAGLTQARLDVSHLTEGTYILQALFPELAQVRSVKVLVVK